MLTMMNAIQPPASQDLRVFTDLLAMMADPAATAARIAELVKVSDDARALIAEARAAEAERSVAQAEHEQALAKASAEAAAELAKAKADFEAERLREANGLVAREKRVSKLEAKLQADLAAAADTQADLDRRLGLLKAATAA